MKVFNKSSKEIIDFLNLNSLKKYLLLISIYSLIVYSLYLYTSEKFIIWIGNEDGLIEYLTALFFLFSSILALRLYFNKRIIWFGLLGILFFVGFGEEISWGQRLFNYSTPEEVKNYNIQGEFNIHNLGMFDHKDNDNMKKSGWRKFTSVQFLFNLFWFGYGIIVPLIFFLSTFAQKIVKQLKLPIPALAIGIFFIIDWTIFRVSKYFLLILGKPDNYNDTINEIFESCAALIFLIILVEFTERLKNEKTI